MEHRTTGPMLPKPGPSPPTPGTASSKFPPTLPLPRSKVRQIDGLQILRALAVLLVASFHMGRELSEPPPIPSLGIYGIDIFFVISGFILSLVLLRTRTPPGPSTAWHFLKRRLVRIFPIYWIFALIAALRLLRTGQLWQHNFLLSFLLLPAPPSPRFSALLSYGWTLVFEMMFYYILSLLLLATTRRVVPIAILLLASLAAAGAVFDLHGSVLPLLCNPILLEFVFGSLIALAFRRFSHRRLPGMLLLASGVAASLLLFLSQPTAADGGRAVLENEHVLPRVFTWGVAAALIVAGVVFWSPPAKSRIAKIGVVLGDASYSTYLASGLIIEALMRVLRPFASASSPAQVVFQIAGVALVFCFGWLCFRFVELPTLNWLHRKAFSKA